MKEELVIFLFLFFFIVHYNMVSFYNYILEKIGLLFAGSILTFLIGRKVLGVYLEV